MAIVTSPNAVITTLNEQWYNALTSQCNLDPGNFQLYQGAGVLGNTTAPVWAAFDAVPPLSTSSLYNPSQANNFSSNYGSMIFSLLAQGTTQFMNDLGDYYVPFMAAWKASTSTDMVAFWKTWSSKNCPSLTARGTSDILGMSNSPVTVSQSSWNAAEEANMGYAYTTTITQVQSAITQGPGKSVTMDSSTQSSNVSQSWAKADASGWYSIFGLGGSSQYDSISTQFASSKVTVKASFSNLATIVAGPLSQPNTVDPILSTYTPWYNSSVMGMAYTTQDNTLWAPGVTPNWNSTFGPNGNILRMCTALIVVDGISSSITSGAAFSASQFQQFQAAASGGIWPFLQASGSGGWTNSATQNADSTITVTSTSPKGNPCILGVLVSGASTLWGGGAPAGPR
jgi:hypothetical protein